MADAGDLKSSGSTPCGFESRPRHQRFEASQRGLRTYRTVRQGSPGTVRLRVVSAGVGYNLATSSYEYGARPEAFAPVNRRTATLDKGNRLTTDPDEGHGRSFRLRREGRKVSLIHSYMSKTSQAVFLEYLLISTAFYCILLHRRIGE